MYRSGTWVMYAKGPAIVTDYRAESGTYILHLVDEYGETEMRDAVGDEAICPQTGNSRPHVTDEVIADESEFRLAEAGEIPASRQG